MPNFSTYKPLIGPGQRDYVTKIAAALDELDNRFNTAAVFAGTVGITGALTGSSTTDSSSSTTGAWKTAGGLGVAKALSVGTSLNLSAAAAGQIVFPASQNPSSNANTFDDYEEGTVTVAFACGTSGTITIDPSFRTLAYVKKGREVTITGFLNVTSVSSPVGALTITGALPFAVGTSSQREKWASASLRCDGLNAGACMVAYAVDTDTVLRIGKFAAGVVSETVAADVKAASNFVVDFTYFT